MEHQTNPSSQLFRAAAGLLPGLDRWASADARSVAQSKSGLNSSHDMPPPVAFSIWMHLLMGTRRTPDSHWETVGELTPRASAIRPVPPISQMARCSGLK